MAEKTSVLVTGGAGFIGSHLVETLLNNGRQVFCVDNLDDYYNPEFKKQNLEFFSGNPGFRFFYSDISDIVEMEKIFRQNRFETVFHLAAKTGVRNSISSPVEYEKTNIIGTTNILELSRKFAVEKIIFASSSSVYGNHAPPFKETMECNFPLSPYAATKKSVELISRMYSYLYGLNVTGLRFFTVYGPRGRPDMAVYSFTEKIFSGQPLSLFGKNTKRDFTYVSDIIEGVLSAEKACKNFELINLGNSKPEKVSTLVSLLEKSTGKKALINPVKLPKEDIALTSADLAKAKKSLGFSPKISLSKGIPLFVDWFKKNRLKALK